MNSLGSHGISSLVCMMKVVMVHFCEQVTPHKVMTGFIVPLPGKFCSELSLQYHRYVQFPHM